MRKDGSTSLLLANQRREWILSWVAQHGAVRVAEVVQSLGVSEMTARRDIADLVNKGLVDRVHGGAIALQAAAIEPTFATKSTQLVREKAAIATAAVTRVRPGQALALTAGSTTLAVAQALARLPHFATLTVVTNSLPAAQVLHEAVTSARHDSRPHPTVMLTGGERTPSDALVGVLSIEAFQTLRLEWVFAGAHGFDRELGLMTPNLAEAATNAAMIRAACTTVAVLDHTKWGIVGLRSFCAPRDLDTIVTDQPAPPDFHHALIDHNIALEVCHDGA
ncbi:MAG: DeoR/GlpR family DNA-binding transcription regulator [Bowdeniella nasicola]|nr:DeoR/GlpR family DNA-binding transcription regulator [Bowdeniella nasicola]